MRVDLLDPPSYSRPYDHALASALARHGAQVQLLTSPFKYSETPTPDGYTAVEMFHRDFQAAPKPARKGGISGRQADAMKRLLADSARLRAYASDLARATADAPDIVHTQWLGLPGRDLRTLAKISRTRVGTVLTIHDPLTTYPVVGLRKPDPRGVDAVIVHTEYGRDCVVDRYGLDPAKVHVVPHGVLKLAPAGELPRELSAPSARDRLRDATMAEWPTVVLYFGLIRPYKGVETLLAAWRQIAADRDAELWVVGAPSFDISTLRAQAPDTVRFVPRFVTPQEEAAIYARTDVCVLPYERSARFGFSGVLATALGADKPIVMTDRPGLNEVGDAALLVEPGNPDALAAGIDLMLTDPAARARFAAAASAAAQGRYSWERAADATLAVYEQVRK